MFVYGLASQINSMARVYRDGTTTTMGQVALNGDTILFDQAPADGEVILNTLTWSDSNQLNPTTLTPDLNKPFTTAVTRTNLGSGVYLRNRSGVMKYYEREGRGYRVRNIATEAIEDTVSVWSSGLNVDRAIQFVNNQTLAFFRSDGSVRLYDTDTKTVVLDSFIDAPALVTVDQQYQTVVSIRASDNTVQIYELAVQPTQMVNFTASPGTYLRYQGEEISITVQGSNSEPAEGVKVEWSLLGVDMPDGIDIRGMITPNISITDSDGKATATYCPPGLDWTMGFQEKIIATVTI